MSYIERLLLRQTALAGRLTTDGETNLSLAQTIAAFAAPQAAETADETRAAGDTGWPSGTTEEKQLRTADTEAEQGAQVLLEAFTALAWQNMHAAALRQQAIERELRRTRESQSVLLSARTPQNSPGGLTGGYEQMLSVAGLAAAPTQRSMAEISRYFERDARRYG